MALIPWLLDLILSLLELFLSTPPKVNNDHDYSGAHQTPEQQTAALEAALEYFELDLHTLTREAVKKKFRRFSLLHHPDRNKNSEESNQMMQKINNYYNLLNEELDRREGIEHESEEEEMEEKVNEESESSPSPQGDSPSSKKNNKKNRGKQTKAAKKRNRRARQRARKQEERQREEMNEEMQKEWEEVKRQQREVRREQHKRKWKAYKTMQTHGLDTKEGREQAYREWQEAVDKMEEVGKSTKNKNGNTAMTGKEPVPNQDEVPGLDDIDDETEPTRKTDTTNAPSKQAEPEPTTADTVPVKPVNLAMECCMETVVVALRVGNTDVVLDSIQSEIMEAFKQAMIKAVLNKRDEISEKEVAVRVATYFTTPLDEDGNTLLHYAVYYESFDSISGIYHLSSSFGILAEVFLKENSYKMTPLDFSKCCVKDKRIPARMKMCTDAAKEDLASKQLWPSLKKSARRLWGILRNVNIAALHRPVNLMAAYMIGTRLFGSGRIISFLFALVSQSTGLSVTKLDDKTRPAVASALLTANLTWHWCCYLFELLSWKILFASIVVMLLGYVVTRSRLWFGIAFVPTAIVFLPLVIVLETIEQGMKLPASIKRDSEVEQSVCLLIFTVGYVLAKMGLAYWYGAEDGDELLVADETLDEVVSFEWLCSSPLETIAIGCDYES